MLLYHPPASILVEDLKACIFNDGKLMAVILNYGDTKWYMLKSMMLKACYHKFWKRGGCLQKIHT